MRRLAALVAVLTFLPSMAGAVTNPILSLPSKIKATFACIMWHESRSTFSHLNLGDNNRYGQSGIFQIDPITWNRWAPLVGVKVPVWKASPYQQELVAVKIWRVDTFWPWHGDGCKIS